MINARFPIDPRAARRRLMTVVWALSVAACATWQGRPNVLAAPLAPRQQVRLWVHGVGHQVHGVQVRGDSVSAVPFIRPPSCDSCAMRYARSAVDSVQVRAFDWRRSLVAAIVVAPLIIGLYALGGMAVD